METNTHQIKDYSAVLNEKYGAPGTPERTQFDEEAYTFYTSQILLDARKEAKVSQSELARRSSHILPHHERARNESGSGQADYVKRKSRLLRYLTGYHTERKPTRRTVTKTTSTSIASTLTG